MMDWKKIIPYLILIVGLVIGGFFLYSAIKSNPEKFLELIGVYINNSKPAVIYVHDTNIVNHYDTLFKEIKVPAFIDRIIYKYSDPVIVREQKVDTVFLERIKYLDLMLTLKKAKDKVSIIAVNEKGKVIKEYEFEGIGNNFTAVSDSGNILMRSCNMEWNGVSWFANMTSNFNKDSIRTPNLQMGFETGVTFFNKIKIDPGIIYDFRGNKFDLNNFKINIKTTLNLIK
jgi:hypothetical protein